MPDIIRDGTGQGYLAKVDDENHLLVTSASEPLIAHRSHYDGSAYGLSTPMRTITTTGGRILWFKNTNTKSFWLTDFWFNWNGGTTSHNRVVFGQFIFDDTEPTTNITTGGTGVLNRAKTNGTDLTILYWDEVGDGMTGHDAGTPAFYWCNGQGAAHYNVGGAIILGTNNTISFNLQGEEVGEASINILGFFR